MGALANLNSAGRGGAALLAPTRRTKAAMLVQLLLREGIELPLGELSEDQQMALAREIGRLRSVDRETLESAATEFVDELESMALTFPGGVDKALTALDGHISEAAANRLRLDGDAGDGYDPWPRIESASAEQIAGILTSESIEVGAVVMSKLPVALAAETLGQLPGDLARKITYAMSRISRVHPSAVARIGMSLARQFERGPQQTFATPAEKRVGAILNSSISSTREDVLGGLTETDPAFAADVRREIFTFANIATRLEERDVAKILREVDGGDLTTALASALASEGPDKASADFILGNISQRLAGQMRDEADELGAVSDDDAELAKTSVTSAIRDMVDRGEISLRVDEDEDGA